MVSQKLLTFFFITFLIENILCERVQDTMYSSINGASCFRRMNGTHSTGCTSNFRGSVGVLHLIENEKDFDFIFNKPTAPPYTLIMNPALFTRDNIINVLNKGKQIVAGIVLIKNTTNLSFFSQESKCPNQFGGLINEQVCDQNDPNHSWNPFGTGLLLEDFPFPVYYVNNDTDVKQMIDCYKKFNEYDIQNQHKRSLCSIQIKTFMSAAVSSEVCIRRSRYTYYMKPMRYCDPLQGKNVYTTLYPLKTVAENAQRDNYIVLATRIDTTSMFDGIAPGAMDSLLSFVTSVSVAHTLTKLQPKSEQSTNVLFMFFNGESYDYVGSQRFAYDIENGFFPSNATNSPPIQMNDIKLFIDIGSLTDPNHIAVYRYEQFNMADKFTKLMQKYNLNENFAISAYEKISKNLPPTSAQSFLRENISFPAIILYSETRHNHFYHSIYDDQQNIKYEYKNTTNDFTNLIDLNEFSVFPIDSIQIAIRNISSILSYSLYELLTGQSLNVKIGANVYLIDEMLNCFINSAQCPLFKAASKPNSFVANEAPPQRYISVYGSLAYESIGWTYRILGLLTGQKLSLDEHNCSSLPLSWYAGYSGNGECYLTRQNFTEAYSPAFFLDDYDWKSGKYSTWTESTWSEINARIFLKPSISHEAYTLSVGIAVLLVSFVFIYLVSSKLDVIFGEATSSENALASPSQC